MMPSGNTPVVLTNSGLFVAITSIKVSVEGVMRVGGTPHMQGVGMLVFSLRGVNFGFWSHLGCSGQNAIIFSREGLF